MTTQALVQRRDYLDGQRRTIIARSVVSAIVGAVPVPFLDDWAITQILGGGYRKIAAAHQVDLDRDAVRNLVHGTTPPPSLVDLASAGIMVRVASRAARRMMVALATVRRAQSAARTFVTMTLFDHYCARLHRGLALDGPTALALRDEITRAIDQTPGALAFHPFRRAGLSAARATLKAPLELADLASGGALRRLLAKKIVVAEPEHVDELEQAMEAALANKEGFLARTVAAVETQLSSEANPFLDGALETLDRRWRARVAADAELKK
ncbi:MAG: hypothetical protein ACM31C_15135 [Acidobacteriota bacterium]